MVLDKYIIYHSVRDMEDLFVSDTVIFKFNWFVVSLEEDHGLGKSFHVFVFSVSYQKSAIT